MKPYGAPFRSGTIQAVYSASKIVAATVLKTGPYFHTLDGAHQLMRPRIPQFLPPTASGNSNRTSNSVAQSSRAIERKEGTRPLASNARDRNSNGIVLPEIQPVPRPLHVPPPPPDLLQKAKGSDQPARGAQSNRGSESDDSVRSTKLTPLTTPSTSYHTNESRGDGGVAPARMPKPVASTIPSTSVPIRINETQICDGVEYVLRSDSKPAVTPLSVPSPIHPESHSLVVPPEKLNGDASHSQESSPELFHSAESSLGSINSVSAECNSSPDMNTTPSSFTDNQAPDPSRGPESRPQSPSLPGGFIHEDVEEEESPARVRMNEESNRRALPERSRTESRWKVANFHKPKSGKGYVYETLQKCCADLAAVKVESRKGIFSLNRNVYGIVEECVYDDNTKFRTYHLKIRDETLGGVPVRIETQKGAAKNPKIGPEIFKDDIIRIHRVTVNKYKMIGVWCML